MPAHKQGDTLGTVALAVAVFLIAQSLHVVKLQNRIERISGRK